MYQKRVTQLIVNKKGDVILNRAKDYYQNDKERLKKLARDKYRNLSEENKNKKREYRRNIYRNLSEEKKQRLKEYRKNYREAKKSLHLIINTLYEFNSACNDLVIHY